MYINRQKENKNKNKNDPPTSLSCHCHLRAIMEGGGRGGHGPPNFLLKKNIKVNKIINIHIYTYNFY